MSGLCTQAPYPFPMPVPNRSTFCSASLCRRSPTTSSAPDTPPAAAPLPPRVLRLCGAGASDAPSTYVHNAGVDAPRGFAIPNACASHCSWSATGGRCCCGRGAVGRPLVGRPGALEYRRLMSRSPQSHATTHRASAHPFACACVCLWLLWLRPCACVRACLCVRVRACLRVRVRACVRVLLCAPQLSTVDTTAKATSQDGRPAIPTPPHARQGSSSAAGASLRRSSSLSPRASSSGRGRVVTLPPLVERPGEE
jgi:hypothetical protein